MPNPIIDCDVDPVKIGGVSVGRHTQGGLFEWSESNVGLYQDEERRDYMGVETRYIEGTFLRIKLIEKFNRKGKPLLNACVLDYLLAHQHLIPESWKDIRVFFWGTYYGIYPFGDHVAYLRWKNQQWQRGFRSMRTGWATNDVVALDARKTQ